jgi:hypothetical protein
MIQSENVDVMTGIIWSNLAMAVVPSATAQGVFYLSPNAGPSAAGRRGMPSELFQRRLAERQFARGGRRLCEFGRIFTNSASSWRRIIRRAATR